MKPTPTTQDQTQDALMDKSIEKIESKLADTVISKVSERVEKQIEGVTTKNQEPLDKLAASKAINDDFATMRAEATTPS